MTNREVTTLEDMLCFNIYAASREITRIYRPILSKFNITYPQYLVLILLWEKKISTVTELGERLYLDSATLTPLLKRLEAAEFVYRKRSAEDERRVEIGLTEKGAALQNDLKDVSISIFEKICKTEENYFGSLDISKELLQKAHDIAR
ncbi:MarR family winged helix-turn-helix transcriptional regulator [Neobacillus sp. NPDC093182]|uniref:MarR family winged helix-turn-helix transcriptional regulator n=1 Tax=Neobacillus sp. NPDC093182 TaxID=3364297 RepID=UPI0037F86152